MDFLHKTANYYITNYDKICIEDLNIKGMVHNHYLAKSISDAGWGAFFNYLSYKAESAGREVIRVNPKGTSQICSRCFEKVEKTLAVRTHRCPYCGLVVDRDENSAVLIKGRGTAFRRQGRTLVHALPENSKYGRKAVARIYC
jgi:putative transposase